MTVNLFDVEVGRDEGDPPGYDTGYVRVGPLIGASALGLSVYELPSGQSVCPYHWEAGDEEWLIVLDGAPTVRTPAGEQQLRAGDTVCFPAGAEGAHEFSGPGRVLVVSANQVPSISVYPESGKLGVRPVDRRDNLNFRRADAVDYWEGEE